MDGGPCPPGANVQEMRDGSQMIHKTNKVTIQIRVKEGEGKSSLWGQGCDFKNGQGGLLRW